MPVNQNLPSAPVPTPAGDVGFAKADEAVINWLAAQGFQSVSSDGPDKAESWPHIQVVKLPAGHSTLYEDSPIVQVEVFHPDYDAAANAAGVAHFWLTDPWQGLRAGQVVGDQTIDEVRGSSPGHLDYQDGYLERFVGSYTVVSRPINPL